jgi:hypothetical protein
VGANQVLSRPRQAGCADLITFDPQTAEIYVDRWFRHNPPMNDKHAVGTRRIVEEIESDVIREKVEAEFQAANEARLSKINPLDTPFTPQDNRRGLTQTGYFNGRAVA